MSALRRLVPLVRYVAWAAALVVVLAIVAERVDAGITVPQFAGAAALLAVAITWVGLRARPWSRRLIDPLVAGGVVGGLAWLLAHHAPGACGRFLAGWSSGWGWPAPLPLLVALALLLALRLLLPPAAGARVGRLVRVEAAKLMAGRLLWVAVVLVAAVPVASGLLQEPPGDATGWSLWAQLFGRGSWAAEILVLVLGAVALAGEIGQGTMKMVLPHAYERAEWVVAKALVLLGAAVLLVGVAFAASGILAATQLGLGDVVKEVPAGFGEEARSQVFQAADVMRSHLVDVGIVAVASAIATAWLALALSSFFTGVVPALSLAFLLYLALRFGDVLLGLSRDVTRLFPPSYPDWMRDIAVNLGRGMNDRWDDALAPAGLAWAALTAALSLLVALRVFDRRELS
jgi:hypothetical protein